ncbi:MAG: DUF1134 domain-containing protein [Hyphomicrobiaceae bacterium]|nr:MAG: DUF1134 domain-containing protein [Hyphomicrobiaceae bacterium]
MRTIFRSLSAFAVATFALSAAPSLAQEQLPWQRKDQQPPPRTYERYPQAPNAEDDDQTPSYPYERRTPQQRYDRNAETRVPYYNSAPPIDPNPAPRRYQPERRTAEPTYGVPYEPPTTYQNDRYKTVSPRYEEPYDERTFSPGEIRDAGHRFFGKITQGLANVIEYSFKRSGRPTAYILGEEGGGAFVAGLRYGEGIMYTKDGRRFKVYWQGPSVGYDFGAEGSKTMTLVYSLWEPGEIFNTFGGIDGSAYVVGGVGITFLTNNRVTLAPIRSGIGLRLGANLGYLKYTSRPTWNPF